MSSLFNAQHVSAMGFGLVIYIIIYAIYLVYLVMNSSKETKLIQRYSGGKSVIKGRQILCAVIGGVLAVLLIVFYFKYA